MRFGVSSKAKRPSNGLGLCYLATSSVTFDKLMRGHFAFMRGAGFDVSAICDPGPEVSAIESREAISIAPVPMQREVRLRSDLLSLVRVYRALRRARPMVVNAGTPKAGFVGILAAFLARVPIRIYTLRGLRSETSAGFGRRILNCTEWVASRCATDIVCVSDSLAQLYIEQGLAEPSKLTVLGSGSSNGIDTNEYCFSPEERRRMRLKLGIADEARVVGFVGRLVADKGIDDLLKAFGQLRTQMPSAVLLLVGGFEDGDHVDARTRQEIESDPEVFVTGFVDSAAPYYSAFDVLVFPSYREGFPNAPLEAASSGIPCVGYDATGTRDAVVDGVTGYLAPTGSVDDLAMLTGRYLVDEKLRAEHGKNGRERALEQFERQAVLENLLMFYTELLRRQRNSSAAECAGIQRRCLNSARGFGGEEVEEHHVYSNARGWVGH